MTSAGVKAVDGRLLKRKGASTRQRILEELEALLQDGPASELRVARVAEAAEVAIATFYSYFESLDAALLALVEQDKFAYAPIMQLLQAPWPPAEVPARARDLVTAYFAFWDEHRAVLRLRNLRGDEGDARFLEARFKVTVPIMDAFAEKLAVAKAAGRLPAHTPAISFAAVILAALERNGSSYIHINRNSRADLIEASAQTLAMWLLGGPAALANQEERPWAS
jgi:AcrR family transcriptional regulator